MWKKKKPEPIPVPRIHHLSSPEVQEAQETCPHTHTHTHTYTVSGIGSVMESCSKWYWNWYWKYHWKSRATFNHVGWSGLRRIQLGSTIWFRYVFQVLLFFCDFLFFQNFKFSGIGSQRGETKTKTRRRNITTQGSHRVSYHHSRETRLPVRGERGIPVSCTTAREEVRE